MNKLTTSDQASPSCQFLLPLFQTLASFAVRSVAQSLVGCGERNRPMLAKEKFLYLFETHLEVLERKYELMVSNAEKNRRQRGRTPRGAAAKFLEGRSRDPHEPSSGCCSSLQILFMHETRSDGHQTLCQKGRIIRWKTSRAGAVGLMGSGPSRSTFPRGGASHPQGPPVLGWSIRPYWLMGT
ncbi:uncharacterized protein LY79DRAFT_558253 [Colletotrichum navitas]|uniref:Uncharacterized protein n=1 Tax=Colletotrichum navitas TaxID=681940 RepID=A0AAD8V4A1_9PEZI|nr:uncharacterized protein LY79DRAFT_558253 [Colletotrichum navitas]KAK1585519.1 hypothetical protein LY79DRAFT_558253 [Colletotrichum navitas]